MTLADIDREVSLGVHIVDTYAGPIAVWDEALIARGYTADEAGAVALAYDLIRDTGELTA